MDCETAVCAEQVSLCAVNGMTEVWLTSFPVMVKYQCTAHMIPSIHMWISKPLVLKRNCLNNDDDDDDNDDGGGGGGGDGDGDGDGDDGANSCCCYF